MQEYTFAQMLKSLRKKKGVTQKDLAFFLSVSNKTVSKWEKGISSPDLSLLPPLAKYFGVSTDTLLGLQQETQKSVREALLNDFHGLERKEAILKAFELVRHTVPAVNDFICKKLRDECTEAVFPQTRPKFCRTRIARPDYFSFTASHTDVNVSVTLLGNESNFSWLQDEQVQSKTAKLFSFLSQKDSLRLLYFIHSKACSESFTADYVATHTDLPLQKTRDLLDALCEISTCKCTSAHLTQGTIKVYECRGDGVLLSIITLAYEQMCGKNYYEQNYNYSCKMIGEA